MPVREDTEITLGTGKLLTIFFGLVAVCAVFFGMGFSLGRAAAKPAASATEGQPSASDAPAGVPAVSNPSASSTSATDLSFYQAVKSKDGGTDLTAPKELPSPAPEATTVATSPAADAAKPQAPPRSVPQEGAKASAYYVQIAAVSRREDADLLLQALKRKQYQVFSATSAADRFFHVQIGPFHDLSDAQAMRAKLISAGYSPILKK